MDRPVITAFTVTGPRINPRIVQTAEEAVELGCSLVYLSPTRRTEIIRQLKLGLHQVWTYGFNEIWIDPIATAKPSMEPS